MGDVLRKTEIRNKSANTWEQGITWNASSPLFCDGRRQVQSIVYMGGTHLNDVVLLDASRQSNLLT